MNPIDFILEVSPVVFTSAFYLYFLWKLSKNETLEKYFWSVSILFFLIIRSRDLYLGYLNPDELQWLVSANSVSFDTKLYFNYFITSEFSRLLTILPLSLFGFFSDYIEVFHARILNICLFLLFCFFQFKIFKLFLQEKIVAYQTTSVLIVALAFGVNPDLIAYNSEISVIVLLSISAIYYLKARQKNNFWCFSLSAFSATLIPFAKDQAIAIAAVFLIGTFLIEVFRKNKVGILGLLTGGIAVVFLFILLFQMLHHWDIIPVHLNNASVYLKMGLGKQNFGFFTKTYLFFTSNFIDLTYLSLSIMAFAGIVLVFKKFKSFSSLEKQFAILILLVLIVTLYVTINPGNNFYHYVILQFFSLAFFIFIFVRWQNSNKQFLQIHFFILALFITFGIFSGKKIYPITQFKNPTKLELDETSHAIRKYSNPGDHLLIWGWDNKYYLESRTFRSTYFLTPLFLDENYPKRTTCISYYLNDIKTIKPKLVVEVIGANRFYFNDKQKWQISSISDELNIELNKNYSVKEFGGNYCVYKLK